MAAAHPGPVRGASAQFGAASLEEVCRQYRNQLSNFQMDLLHVLPFISRVLEAPPGGHTPLTRSLLEQAIKAAVHLANLDPDILRIGLNSGITPGAEPVIKVLEATHVEPEIFRELQRARLNDQADEVRRACRTVLARHPMAVRYADLLLAVSLFDAQRPDAALESFNCPKVLRPLWQKRLFNHYATLGDDANAWPLWEALGGRAEDPFTLSRAAELYRRGGDREQAMALYARALELDPLQRPYALRLAELRTPFVPDAGLVERKRVCIYLYSWNKAELLGETLESLAQCSLGPARITVLLNGCTDHSRDVVERAKGLFPRNELEIVELPVNVGAPAARNWLLSLPSTRECEYVAFLDDDILLQPDWLAHMLTVAERDPRIGNVGCKVVFPGEFRMLQYLYRYVAVSDTETVRVSLPTPHVQFDTGLYDVVRETRVVMGCQHLLRTASLADAPWFDIRYSPSQIDDTDHDLQLCLAGWKVWYCGTVTCVHRQNSGTSLRSKLSLASQGSVMGNDVKFFYKWVERREELRALDDLSLNT